VHIATVILTALLALMFLGTGAVKIVAAPRSMQMRKQLRVDGRLWSSIGLLEVAACIALAVGLDVPLLGLVASIGLLLLMIGAIAAHVRVGDVGGAAPAALLVVLVVALIMLRTAAGF
jgi:uncharacterized membrane protein YphA (DoxX/SURF4 family)